MKYTICFIRHGKTKGNLEGRYLGRTDEPILEEFKEKLKPQKDDSVGKIFVSPMIRCRETAAVLFPNANQIVIDEFSECDFGDYEYKTYEDLKDEKAYQDFIDSNGRVAFPGGESLDLFQKRSLKGFKKVLESVDPRETIYIVAHGGTIMALFEAFVKPHKDYYDWMVKNGEGYFISYDTENGGTVLGLYPGYDIR